MTLDLRASGRARRHALQHECAIERARPALAAQLARESDDLARAALSEALRALAGEVR